ncbi:MAG: CDP-alcohol phosphatidyltransferase family protein [Alphaproteobacteria bacterium]|nr:CDP-alcohol phosphatidyltransferase family protein [Alphaproteobacteria bacterium]
MLDAVIRPHIDKPLAAVAHHAVRLGVSANAATLAGFTLGMAAAGLIAAQLTWVALGVLLVSRFFDGLDGAIARRTQPTDLGGYLDITLDFIVYASVVFAFALADPARNALAAAFLTTSFMAPAATFLAYAVFAAKRGITTEIRGAKSLYYLGGLTEGTETILTLCLMCAFPDWFAIIAVVYGLMCWITGGTRIAAAVATFGDAAAAGVMVREGTDVTP